MLLYISAEKYVLVCKKNLYYFFCPKDMIILLLLWPHQMWRGKTTTYHYSIVYKVMRMNKVGGCFFFFFC